MQRRLGKDAQGTPQIRRDDPTLRTLGFSVCGFSLL